MANTDSVIIQKLAEKMREQVKCPHLCGSECCAPEWDSRGDQAVHMRNAYYKAAEEVIEFLNNEITEQNKQIQMLANEEEKSQKRSSPKSGN